jgi:hydroxymethylpyrimidine/phosphomethylpyrimidine kinase
VAAQIRSVAADMGADAVKTGMLAGPAIVEMVAKEIARHALPHVVVDPVMVAKSGDPLLSKEARTVLRDGLLPLAEVITPNAAEAEVLTGISLTSIAAAKDAAAQLKSTGCQWVVIKGGHLPDLADTRGSGDLEAIDIVYDGKTFTLLRAAYFEGKSVHGTGCTFSAAIAAGLAQGREPLEAIQRAKMFITRAIETSLAVGKGHPAPNHFTGTQSDWA